jgi:o-succinylbenzoate synthase
MIQATFEKRTFQFKQPSGTSRGILTEKHAWFLTLIDTKNLGVIGLGECSIIPGLSPDYSSDIQYEQLLSELCHTINSQLYSLDSLEELFPKWIDFPSILFGFETAVLDLKNGGKGHFYDTSFVRGESKIPINGLIWMGAEGFMQQQIEQKLEEGFTCIKMKIGAIDFENEYRILKNLRQRYSKEMLTLRVDANGAFSPKDAFDKLAQLAALGIHSIEQPIQVRQHEELASLCRHSPVPIALDEELIGVNEPEAKRELLEKIHPQFIILKPSLHGGILGITQWIELAEELCIPWWITSALESNVGLNHIAQFTSKYPNLSYQGLGTGSLYVQILQPD